ncbi:MAG: hypothetical protein AAF593_14745 [Planctomycetota bacterium]
MNIRKTLTAALALTLLTTPSFAQNPLDPASNNAGNSGNPLDPAGGQGGQQPPAQNTPAGFVSFNPYTLKDPGMDNMDAFTMLVPEGWRVNGGVRWRPTEIEFAPLIMSMVGPRSEEVAFLPPQAYAYTELDVPQIAGMPPVAPPKLPALGSRDRDGNIFLPIPQSTQDYLTQIYLPTNRPNARNVQILEMTPMNDMRQLLEQQLGPMLQHARQMGAQLHQMAQMSGGQHQTDAGLFADLFKIKYVENGVTFIEVIPVGGFWQSDVNQAMHAGLDQFGNMTQEPGIRSVQQRWVVMDGKAFRSPADTFDQSLSMMVNAALSVKPTPHYFTRMMELKRKIAAIRHKANMDRLKHQQAMHELRMKTNQEIFEMHQDSYRKANKAREEQHDQFLAYIRDEEWTKDPETGTPYTHPQNTRLYKGPDGQIGYAPRGMEPPYGWTPVGP